MTGFQFGRKLGDWGKDEDEEEGEEEQACQQVVCESKLAPITVKSCATQPSIQRISKYTSTSWRFVLINVTAVMLLTPKSRPEPFNQSDDSVYAQHVKAAEVEDAELQEAIARSLQESSQGEHNPQIT